MTPKYFFHRKQKQTNSNVPRPQAGEDNEGHETNDQYTTKSSWDQNTIAESSFTPAYENVSAALYAEPYADGDSAHQTDTVVIGAGSVVQYNTDHDGGYEEIYDPPSVIGNASVVRYQ